MKLADDFTISFEVECEASQNILYALGAIRWFDWLGNEECKVEVRICRD